MSGSAEVRAGNEQQVIFLRPLAKRAVIRLQRAWEQIERALRLDAGIAHFRQTAVQQVAVGPIHRNIARQVGAAGRDALEQARRADIAERTACAVAFCETIRSAGYSAGVYSYASWFYNALNFANISKYNIWIAQYRDTLSFSYKHNIWQYTGSGSVKGISKPVDMNIG